MLYGNGKINSKIWGRYWRIIKEKNLMRKDCIEK